MKFLTLFLFSTLFLYGSSFHYLITKDKLKNEIYKKFPIEKKNLLTSIVLSEPRIELKSSKLILNTKVSLPRILDENNQALQTKITLSSGVTFKAPNQLFLNDIKIINIENNILEPDQKELMLLSLNLALNSYFKNHVAYTINYDDIKNDLAKMAASYLKSIEIKSEGIDLLFEF